MKVGYSPDYVSLPGCYTTPATPRQMSMDFGECRSRPYSPDYVSLLQHIMRTNPVWILDWEMPVVMRLLYHADESSANADHPLLDESRLQP